MTRKKQKNYIDKIEIKKASPLIHSEIIKDNKYYKMTSLQYNIFNYLLYAARKQLLKLFKNEKELIEIHNNFKNDLEYIIDKMWFEIDINELKNVLPENSAERLFILNKVIKELRSITIKVDIMNENINEEWYFGMIRKHKVDKKNNKIKYKLEYELFQLLYYFKPYAEYTFAIYKLKKLFNLSTTSTKKLYEFLIDWKYKKEITIDLLTLIKIMNLNPYIESNKKYGTFNRNHLKKAIQEINEKTDIEVTYEKEKIDGETYITFYIEKKPNVIIKDPEEEYIELKLKAKSRTKLEKLIKSGYKVNDKEAWIQKDIEKNREKYLAEMEIDSYLDGLNEDDIRNLGFELAKFLDEEYILIDKENYTLKNIDGQFITADAIDTLKILNKYLDYIETNEN